MLTLKELENKVKKLNKSMEDKFIKPEDFTEVEVELKAAKKLYLQYVEKNGKESYILALGAIVESLSVNAWYYMIGNSCKTWLMANEFWNHDEMVISYLESYINRDTEME